MKFRYHLWALLCLLLAYTPFISAQIIQYENSIVERIDITLSDNDPLFNKEAILHMINTRERGYFSQVVFDQDLKTLAREFDTVAPSIEVIDGKLHISIALSYIPILRTIEVVGNHHFSSSTIIKEMELHTGKIFDRKAFAESFNKLKQFYMKKGHFEAEFDYMLKKDELTNDIDLEIIIDEGRSGRIKDIRFYGFTGEEKKEILDLMLTKRWHFLFSFFNDDGIYNPDMVQQDQLQITHFIQNRGFADAVVTITVTEASGCDRIFLDISLERGEIYHIGEVTVEGNVLFDTCDIFPLLQIHPQGVFSPEGVHNSVQAISDLYGTYGYIDAIVDFDLVLDEECDLYHVHYHIEEGSQYRVGLIKIFGNCITNNSVILHETILVPGEIFNIIKLKLTEERLTNVGYFEWVNVYAVKTEDSELGDCYRDVHIEVAETSTGSVSASFGFSNIETIFGGLSLSEKNFNYKGIPYLLRGWDGLRHLRGNGEYAFISATLGTKSREYGLSWAKPYFMDSQWIVGFDLTKSTVRYQSEDYFIKKEGFTLHAKRPINAFVRVGLYYRLSGSHMVVLKKKEPTKEELEDAKIKGTISAIGTSLTYDSTDSPFRPWEGFRSRLQGEYAGLGGDHHFYSLAYLNSWYTTVSENGVVKIRADFRFVLPVGNTSYKSMPVSERLFLGGDTGVRGYKPYALGPTYKKGEDDPRGGLSLNLLSWEYAHYINDYVEGFTFFDVGSIRTKTWGFGHYHFATGAGLRISVMGPAGPQLTLGLGYPINEKNHDAIERFFFQVGGNF